MNKGFIVSGIHTNVGKTFVSAVLLAGTNWDYWKPIQTGIATETSDTQWLKNILGKNIHFYPERYALPLPASPNIAADEQNIIISIHDFVLPSSNNPILVEGAGGLLVPINQQHLLIDLFQKLDLPLILVSDLYLGAINHTLLSIEVLKSRKMNIKGIIFNKTEDIPAMKIIEHYSGVKNLGFIPKLEKIGFSSLKSAFDKYLSEI